MILRHLGMVTLLSTALVLGSCASARKQTAEPPAAEEQFEEPSEAELENCYATALAYCTDACVADDNPAPFELACGNEGRLTLTGACKCEFFKEEQQ